MEHVPFKPAIADEHSAHHVRLHERVMEGRGLILVGRGLALSITADGSYKLELAGAAQLAGDSWPPTELDPSRAVSAGDWRYVSPLNPLATTGLIDLVLDPVVVKAPPGLWRARRAVPAAAAGKYNVPQLPYPGAGAAPSGTPLKGDVDGANVFWVQIQEYNYCANNP